MVTTEVEETSAVGSNGAKVCGAAEKIAPEASATFLLQHSIPASIEPYLLRVPAPRLQSGHRFKAEESGGLLAAAALHGAGGGIGRIEDHGLAFGVGGTVDGW